MTRLPTNELVYELDAVDTLTDEDRAKLLKEKFIITLRGTYETMAWGKVIHQEKYRGKVYFRDGRFCCRWGRMWLTVTIKRWKMELGDGRIHSWLDVAIQ